MGQEIEIAADLTFVALNGTDYNVPGFYNGGDVVALTDDEYTALQADTAKDAWYTEGDAVADPERPAASLLSPGSEAAQALVEANAYTDAEIAALP